MPNFLTSLDTYILKTYGPDIKEKVAPFFNTLSTFRLVLSPSSQSTNPDYIIKSLEHYLAGVSSMESKVPLTRAELSFNWADSYSSKSQNFATYDKEKISVNYVLSAYWSKIGAETDLFSPTGHKVALNAFQTAAGLLGTCKELSSSQIELINDLHPDNFQLWIDVMSAQGYLTMFDKIDKQNGNKTNLSKLAFAIYNNYKSAAEKSRFIESFPKDMTALFLFYSDVFLAASELYSGLVEIETVPGTGKGFGAAVARLKLAERVIGKAENARGISGKPVEIMRNIANLIRSERGKAEEENYRVFMESVPEEVKFACPDSLSLFSGKKNEPKPFPEQDLINILMSSEVQDLHQDYENTMMEEFLKTQEKVEKSWEKYEKFVKCSTFNGLPKFLWNEISKAQKGLIDGQIENLQSFIKSCENELVREREKLMNEELEDSNLKKTYTKEWNRVPSCITNADFKMSIEKMLKNLEETKKEDFELIEEYKEKESQFRDLAQSKEQLDRLVPKLELSQEASRDSLMSSIKETQRLLQSVLEIYKQGIYRKSSYETLKKVYRDRRPKQEVFNEIRSNFLEYHSEIDRELEKLSQKIEKFFKEFSNLSVENRAGKTIENLSNLLDLKRKIMAKLDERLAFYSKQIDEIQKLSVSIEGFLTKRQFEKQDLLGRVSRNSLQKPVASNIPVVPPKSPK